MHGPHQGHNPDANYKLQVNLVLLLNTTTFVPRNFIEPASWAIGAILNQLDEQIAFIQLLTVKGVPLHRTFFFVSFS